MNTLFRQFRLKQGTISNVLRYYNKNTVKDEQIASRLSLKTPFSIDINKNMLKSKWFLRNENLKKQNILPAMNLLAQRDLHDVAGGTNPKKRIGFRKKRSEYHEKLHQSGYSPVYAYATAEEYDLEKLLEALKTQNLYEPKKLLSENDVHENHPDVLYATAKYKVRK
jgi:uncharacterized Rmd1/YagE family protein